MARRWSLRAAVATCALLAAACGPGIPSAAAVSPPIVRALTVSPAHVAVTGWETATVRVEARIVDPGGVGACAFGSGPIVGSVTAELTRVGGGAADRVYLYLNRVAGMHGVFSGAWRVGSTRNGVWTVTGLWWCHGASAGGQDGYSVNPRVLGLTPSIEVTGSDAPTMSITRRPAIVPFGAPQQVIVSLRDGSGRPIAGRSLTVGDADDCGVAGNGGELMRTDSRGELLVDSEQHTGGCVFLATPQLQEFGAFERATLLSRVTITRAERFRVVSATPSSWRIRSTVRVTGRIEPRFGIVALQRAGAHGWITLVRGAVAPNGTYSLRLSERVSSASAPAAQLHRYRVVVSAPPGSGLVATASQPLSLRWVG